MRSRGKLKIVLFLMLGTVVFSSFANSQVDSASANAKWEIMIDGGKLVLPLPLYDRFGLTNWEQRYSIRAGVGREILHFLWWHAFVEYRRYNSPLRWGELNPLRFQRSYVRSDFAFYLSFTALGWFQAGAGCIAQFHEDMVYYWPLSYPRSTEPQLVPAAKRLKLFYVAGGKYDIPLGRDFYIPAGIFFDSFFSRFGNFRPTFRLGLSKRF